MLYAIRAQRLVSHITKRNENEKETENEKRNETINEAKQFKAKINEMNRNEISK